MWEKPVSPSAFQATKIVLLWMDGWMDGWVALSRPTYPAPSCNGWVLRALLRVGHLDKAYCMKPGGLVCYIYPEH